MPKDTFYNLPKEKKEKLIEALHHEFSTYSLAKASIARIIAYAGIPRGSFYQYFIDKEDAYFYLFNKQTDEAADRFYELVHTNKGNIFKASIDFYHLIIEDNHPFSFFRLAVLNTDYQIYQSLTGIFVQEIQSDHFQKFYDVIDLSLLQVNNKEQLHHLMKVLSSIIFYNYREMVANNIPLETTIADCQIQLGLLKDGVATSAESV